MGFSDCNWEIWNIYECCVRWFHDGSIGFNDVHSKWRCSLICIRLHSCTIARFPFSSASSHPVGISGFILIIYARWFAVDAGMRRLRAMGGAVMNILCPIIDITGSMSPRLGGKLLVSSLLSASALTSLALDSAISMVRRLMVWVRAVIYSISAKVVLARLDMVSMVSCCLSALCPDIPRFVKYG